MTRRRFLPLALAPLLLGVPRPADAQRGDSPRNEAYSYLSYVSGDVSLVSQSDDDTSARVNTPVSSGDRISTGASARAEAILSDGTILRFDARTEARFDRLARTWGTEDDRTLVALTSGALAVETHAAADEESAIRIDSEDATVVIPSRGLVRVDAGRLGTEVYVLAGSALVMARSGRATLRAGESAVVRGEEAIDVAQSDLPRDRFTQFLEERRSVRTGSESVHRIELARTAEAEVEEPYDESTWDYQASSLDDYGSWVYVSGSSRWCWRPRVGADWRPYSLGSWRYSPGGLSWVSYEPWGWMPYHYGSWGFDASFGWCWSPGWAYSPAWVYWNYTPSWVGWCPIGYYGGYDAWHHGHGGHDSQGVGHGGQGGGHGGGGHGGQGGHVGRWEPGSYPHLRGRVDVAQIDPKGWSYTAANRIGTHLERTDVVRGDRVGFRRGETGVIATAPLRVERTGGTVRSSIQDAIRRVPAEAGSRASDPALGQILRRDRTLSPATEETLQRSLVRAGRDSSYRPLPPEQIASARFETPRVTADTRAGSARTGSPSPREVRVEGTTRSEGWRSPGGGERRVGERIGSPRAEGRADDSWRTSPRGVTMRAAPDRFRRDDAGSPRTDASPGTRAFGSGDRDHSGWRAPAPRGEREARSGEGPRGESAPRRVEPSAPSAPRHEAPRAPEVSTPRREMRSYAYEPRQAPPPRSYEAPRHEAPRVEAPRAAPHFDSAPRSSAPRFDSAPRSAPHSSAPAPSRSERRP